MALHNHTNEEDFETLDRYHMTVGDLRQLLAEERFDLVDPDEEVGVCYNCGGPITLYDVAQSEYDDDTFVEDATEVLCSECQGWEL